MRKKDDTLRDKLLELARHTADTQGVAAINIRSIAKKAGVATGTVYNYFSSKDEILLALTEEFWRETLLEMKDSITADSFCEQLQEIFSFLSERIGRGAGKLMSSLSNVEMAGQASMVSMQAVLQAALVNRIEQDAEIRRDIWDETFTKEQFSRFVMMNMMLSLKDRAPDINFFITILKHTIY